MGKRSCVVIFSDRVSNPFADVITVALSRALLYLVAG